MYMNKLELLQKRLKELGKVAIAYSGGVDSHFLLAAAAGCLPGECILPILGSGVMMSQEEEGEARERMTRFQTPYFILKVDVLRVPEFEYNDPLRCYHCKKYLMSSIRKKASEMGFASVLDGKNLDDGAVYRPGARAASELGILSPLFECGFTKQEIRDWSRKLGLETWDKPANACLATRFPYGTHLTEEKLRQVAEAEKALHQAGVREGRVRVHERIARIEAKERDFAKILGNSELIESIKAQGFSFVTLDLEGFRSGSFDGERSDQVRTAGGAQASTGRGEPGEEEEPEKCRQKIKDEVTVLETNLDDSTGEWMGYAMELLLEAGARDVFYTPIFMKKNRPAYQMTVLCDEENAEKLAQIIFRETTTIGIRQRKETRMILSRRQTEVDTRYGKLKVKEVSGGRIYPEYESARELAREQGAGLPDIYRSIKE